MACGDDSGQSCQPFISLTDPGPWWHGLIFLVLGASCFALGWSLFKGRLPMRTSLPPEQMARIDKAVGAIFMLFGTGIAIGGLLGLGSSLIVSPR